MSTRGKGPFARRARPDPPDYDAPRWSPPRVPMTENGIRFLLRVTQNQCDAGVHKLFTDLAELEPRHRLARNMANFSRCLAERDVTDVLQGGFTKIENGALLGLEQLGIPMDLLGIAHGLLNARERQAALRMGLGDLFMRVED